MFRHHTVELALLHTCSRAFGQLFSGRTGRRTGARFVTCPRSRGRSGPARGRYAGSPPKSAFVGGLDRIPPRWGWAVIVGTAVAVGAVRRGAPAPRRSDHEGDTRERGVASNEARISGSSQRHGCRRGGEHLPSPGTRSSPRHQQPPPDTASEALAQYKELTGQAEQVNEDLLAARTDLEKKHGQLARPPPISRAPRRPWRQAAADEEAFRGQVDVLTNASFQGARFNKLSALLTGSSAEDFLERAVGPGRAGLGQRGSAVQADRRGEPGRRRAEQGRRRAEEREGRDHRGQGADRQDDQDQEQPRRADREGRGRVRRA